MNKQELEHKLEQARKDRLAADLTFENEIISLEKQLAEAEKPKLRHGDYGYFFNDGSPRIVINSGVYDKHNKCGRIEDKHFYNILGNIFDELQALKPLEEFEMDVHTYGINRDKGWAHAPIHIAGNNHTLAELSAFILNLRCIEYKLKLDEAKK